MSIEKTIQCDGCGASGPSSDGAAARLNRLAQEQGWTVAGGDHFCPQCGPRPSATEEREAQWRRAIRAYIGARGRSEPTTAAVLAELPHLQGHDHPEASARNLIARLKKNPIWVEEAERLERSCDRCGKETTPGEIHVCFGGQDPPMPTRRGAAILAELVERAWREKREETDDPTSEAP